MHVNNVTLSVAKSLPQPDDLIIENVWRLLKLDNNRAAMVELLGSLTKLPPFLVSDARASRSVGIRAAYLSRSDTPIDEIASVLRSERRAEAFAALIPAANSRPELAEILFEHLHNKPTKSLAKAMFMRNFTHVDSLFLSLRLLVDDLTVSPTISTQYYDFIDRCASDPKKLSAMLEFLPLTKIPSASYITNPDDQLRLIARLVSCAELLFAAPPPDSLIQNVSNPIDRVRSTIMALASLPDLTDQVVAALDAVSVASWFTDGYMLIERIAVGLARILPPPDSNRLAARTASVAEVNYRLPALVNSPRNTSASTALGFLENEAAYTNPFFDEFVRKVDRALLTKAMISTRSDALFACIWRAYGANTPDACWEFVSDRPTLVTMLSKEVLSQVTAVVPDSPMSNITAVTYKFTVLLRKHVPCELVVILPWALLTRIGIPAHKELAAEISRLQLKFLGDDFHRWECFNTLADNWSGSFGDLLSAAVTV